MQSRCRIWVIGLGLLCGGGCGLAETSIHVAAYKIGQRLQEHEERARNLQWAEEAWQSVRATHPDLALSDDYAAGFKAGFAEYVWRGGTGEPPPMPPLKYRDIRYQTPLGYQAIEAWFNGYRHGAGAAQQGGYHDLVTGPSSLRNPPAPALAPPQLLQPQPFPPIETRPAPPVKLPVLPLPRTVPGNETDENPMTSRAPEVAPSLTAPPRSIDWRPEGKEPPLSAPDDGSPDAIAAPSDVGARSDLATRWDWLDPRSGQPVWKRPAPTPSAAPARTAVEPPGGPPAVKVRPPLRVEEAAPAREPVPAVRILPTPAVRVLPPSANAGEAAPRLEERKEVPH